MLLLPFFLVLLISIGASYFAARKKSEYFLADRSLSWPMLLGTFLGAQIGGGFILGNTEASFQHGLFGSLYGLGIALGMLVLGLGFGAKLRLLGVGTIPELLVQKYGSIKLQKIASVVSILSLAGGLMCQAIGLKKFLASLGGGGELIYCLSWGAVVLYTTFGGLLAVVWTDAIQAVIMIGMLVVTFFVALMPHMSTIVAEATQMGFAVTELSLSSLLYPLCFIFVQQDMAQRCFAAKSPRDATIGSLLTAVCLIVLTGIPTVCGIFGHAMHLSREDGAIFMQVMERVSHPAVTVMAGSAVLLAIISTASAILLALSSNVATDLIGGQKKGGLITLVVGVGALLGPYLSDDIIGGLVLSYEVAVGALFVPTVCAVLSKKVCLPKEAAIGSALLGSLGTVAAQVLALGYAGALLPLVLSMVGFVVGLAVSKRRVQVAGVGSD
jgi:SSS family solute:Na+ symporter